MRKTDLQGKMVGLLLCATLMLAIPMSVKASATEAPDTVGMSLVEAETALSAYGEVIVTYGYSETEAADVVMAQSIEGDTIQLQVSLGTEPEEELYTTSETQDKLGSFGLSAYSTESAITIDGDFSDWQDKPYTWEYPWDNSASCWEWGVWGNGLEGYKTSEGTFDNNVRHKVSFFVDNEFAYLYVQIATSDGSYISGNDYNFYDSQGDMAKFSMVETGRKQVVLSDAEKYGPGVHEFTVIHGAGSVSWESTPGAKVCVKIHEDLSNTEMEFRIPLAQMKAQNPDMRMEDMGAMQWENPHLSKDRVTSAGADTAPFVTAAIALLGVPVCTVFLRKKELKRRKRVGNNE